MPYYLKNYPNLDGLATQFGLARSKACEQVYDLRLATRLTLQTIGVAPCRTIDNIDDMHTLMGKLKTILIDATERPYFRSRDPDCNQLNYSGKKKCFTRKNTAPAARGN